MRTNLLAAILDRIEAKVPAIIWIDKDWGQLEIPAESYPLQFPCALVSFPDIPWNQLKGGYYDGVVTVNVRVAIDMYNDTYTVGNVTAPDRATALSRMNIVDDLNAGLSGFEDTWFQKLVHIESKEEKRADGLLVFNEIYETRLTDNSAVPVRTTVVPKYKIDGMFADKVE